MVEQSIRWAWCIWVMSNRMRQTSSFWTLSRFLRIRVIVVIRVTIMLLTVVSCQSLVFFSRCQKEFLGVTEFLTWVNVSGIPVKKTPDDQNRASGGKNCWRSTGKSAQLTRATSPGKIRPYSQLYTYCANTLLLYFIFLTLLCFMLPLVKETK